MTELNLPGLLEAVLLPSLAVGVLLFSAFHFTRGRRAEALGALATSAVLGLASLASGLELDPWLEGGWWMWLVAASGAYAIGSAVASRLTQASGPRLAALFSLGLTLVTGGALRAWEMSAAREAVLQAAPIDRELILAGASHEAWRPVQLAALLAGVAALVLVQRRRTRAALAGSATSAAPSKVSSDERTSLMAAAH